MAEEWRRFERAALELFGLALTADQLDRLSRYVALVETWAEKTNLISVDSTAELLERHVLDSLAPIRLLGEARSIVDFGSGAGLPGIPLAVAEPQRTFFLLESRRRRASFLKAAVRALELSNASPQEARGEAWDPGREIDLVVARAVRREVAGSFAATVLGRAGRLLLMEKDGETAPPPAGFMFDVEHRYRLPKGAAHRVTAWRLGERG
jgi:16S rRNA (guanine527-N7)-methyltransferase